MHFNERDNYIRNATFQGADYIPSAIHISGASWDQWRDDMEDVVARHPRLWPGFEKGKQDWNRTDFGPAHTIGQPFTDAWGCTWETSTNGIEGVVTDAPLKTWADFDTWEAPDPLKTADRGPVDWEAIAQSVADARERGEVTRGGVPHGFFFMRLTYLRGFENMMMDMAYDEPRLWELIDVLYRHNRVLVDQFLAMNVDIMEFAEDLGAQTASVISPEMFRKYCRPTYEKLIQPCRERGILVGLHSDGYIMDLVDDLIIAGVTILNPQDLCNGIDNLREALKDRVCIRLDIDRQTVLPYGTPQEIEELIELEVRTLGSPRGGLELIAGIYPPTPPDNVHALACAIEKYQTYWADGRGKR